MDERAQRHAIDWTEVRTFYEQGRSMRECRARFGFSNYAWDKAAIDGLIVPRDGSQKRWKHDTRLAVQRLLERGMSQSEVAFELGLSKPTVSYHARRLGLPRDQGASRRFDWKLIQEAHDAGLSARQCCARFGCSRSAWADAVRTGRLRARSHVIPIDELLVEGRLCHRGHLRGRLLKAGLKEERCEECGLTEWRGCPIRVTLHHINGDGYDNRLENLAFLCPNCHSQTPNFSGRNGHLRARPQM